jgi:hypothetical protein
MLTLLSNSTHRTHTHTHTHAQMWFLPILFQGNLGIFWGSFPCNSVRKSSPSQGLLSAVCLDLPQWYIKIYMVALPSLGHHLLEDNINIPCVSSEGSWHPFCGLPSTRHEPMNTASSLANWLHTNQGSWDLSNPPRLCLKPYSVTHPLIDHTELRNFPSAKGCTVLWDNQVNQQHIHTGSCQGQNKVSTVHRLSYQEQNDIRASEVPRSWKSGCPRCPSRGAVALSPYPTHPLFKPPLQVLRVRVVSLCMT